MTRTTRGIRYERRGSGPTVVLLHGWCLSHRMWIYEMERLSADHDVIAPDLPGFGASAHLGGPFELDRYVDDVRALVDELDVTEAVLVGFAFGADIAVALAAADPVRLSAVVAVGITSGAGFPAEKMIRSMRRDWPDFARRSAVVLCTRNQSPATVSWLEAIYAATALTVAVAGARLLADFDPHPLVSRVTVPILFMHGDRDEVCPVSLARDCASIAPRGELAVVADCGHLVVLDCPDAMHEALVTFLAEHSVSLCRLSLADLIG